MTNRFFLVCGVLSSILYIVTDVLAAIFYGEYHSFTSQAISELMARGAPTERLVDPFFLLYDVLLVAFGVGVWMTASATRRLRVTAGLLIGVGVLGLGGPTLFEMNMRGTSGVEGDLPHIILTGVMGLLIVGAVGVGAFAQGTRFRIYSFATLLLMLVSGVLTGMQAERLAAGEPTPWFGALERINIGAYLLWVAVLAIALLREERASEPSPGRRVRLVPRAAQEVFR